MTTGTLNHLQCTNSEALARYRGTLLSRDALSELGALRPHIAMRDTALLWLQIVLGWALAAAYPSVWVALALAPWIGTRYYALYIIGHDGLHRRIFSERHHNDLWNDLFILGPIGAITHLNRHNHMRHHRELAMPSDPDRYKYVAAHRESRLAALAGLTGIPFVFRAVGNVFFSRSVSNRKSGSAESGYILRDVAILLGWQIGLAGGLTLLVGWWGYPLLWLLPVYVFTFAADLARVFLEHSALTTDAEADRRGRLVSFTSNSLERQFFAPMSMNFHATHHLWPQIPYYNLPEADRRVRESCVPDGGLEWRASYVRYLFEYVSSRPWFGKRAAGVTQ